MNVRDFSSPFAESCHLDTNLAASAALLWEHNCGMLPVVDDRGKVVGVLTDRDICMALGTRNQLASEVLARDVMSSPVATVHLGDSITHALKVMRQFQVRRLPVVSEDGVLESILSLNDLILASKEGQGGAKPAPSLHDVMVTLKAISTHTAIPVNAPEHRELAAV